VQTGAAQHRAVGEVRLERAFIWILTEAPVTVFARTGPKAWLFNAYSAGESRADEEISLEI